MQHVHTPAPWTQEDNQIFGADGSFLICTMSCSDDFPCIDGDDAAEEVAKRADCDAECLANANMILAAPEMLAVLRAIEGLPGALVDVERAGHGPAFRAAVMKAEGGDNG